MTNEEKKSIHMLQSYVGMTHKLTDNQGRPKLDQAIDTVLNLLEKRDNRIKELESDKEIKDKMINDMAEVMSAICTGISTIRELFEECYCEFLNSEEDCCWKTNQSCKDCIKQYFENLAKESGEIDDKRI